MILYAFVKKLLMPYQEVADFLASSKWLKIAYQSAEWLKIACQSTKWLKIPCQVLYQEIADVLAANLSVQDKEMPML